MQARLEYYKAAPEVLKAMMALETAAVGSGLEHSLIELVKTRASQINNCAYCLHMHTRDARKAGESEERLYLLSAWRESPLFTARERAALTWTEALTNLPASGAPDADYEAMAAEFAPDEQAKLTLMIATINAWNRFGVGFRLIHPA